MSKDEMQEQVVDKKKNKIVLFAGILGVLLLVVLGVVITPHIISANKDRKVNEQLEEAQHFLDDLDYEQAIVAYEAVIEIDPMSVEAYLGLADVYVEQGMYEEAIEVLENGYELNPIDVFSKEIQNIEEMIERDVEFVSEEDETELGTNDNESINNIIRPTYYEYDLSEADAEYLNQIITLFDDEQYNNVTDAINYEKLKKIIETYGNNIIFNNKKIYIECPNYENIEIESVSILIIPLDFGNGYGVHLMKRDAWSRESILYGECKDGFFNGEFTCIEETISDEVEIYEIKGVAKDDMLVGDVIYSHSLGYAYVHTYNEGYLVYSDLKEENGFISYCGGYYLSEGERAEEYRYNYSNDYSVEDVKESVENRLCTIMEPLSRMGYIAYCPF